MRAKFAVASERMLRRGQDVSLPFVLGLTLRIAESMNRTKLFDRWEREGNFQIT